MASTLFPPIMDSWMPAFVGECNIYFTLSNYNSLSNISGVQISVRNAKNNKSALADIYTAEVKNITKDNIKIEGDKYYITLYSSDIRNGFVIDQYYKIQLRFIDIGVGSLEVAPKVDWLNLYQNNFSEWSRVCLIKPISMPSLTMVGLEENSEVTYSSELTTLSGYVHFDDNVEENEFLKQYQIFIRELNEVDNFYQSDIIETDEYNLNVINYILPVELENKKSYSITIKIYTNNGYSKTYNFAVRLDYHGMGTLEAKTWIKDDLERGAILIHVEAPNNSVSEQDAFKSEKLVIRRSSDDTGFHVWEDVYTHVGPIDWYDCTIKSGKYYAYQVQRVNAQGTRSGAVSIPVFNTTDYNLKVDFEDCYLMDSTLQIKVKYDVKINNYKHTLLESKTDTIGSQYPFIRRNGNVDYRQFAISGTISYEMDDQGIYIAKEDLFNEEVIDLYNTVVVNSTIWDSEGKSIAVGKNNKEIGVHNDYIYEREFREKIIEFLYNSEVKLFRSLTEGNVLVKLMDVSLTPNETLGRMIYSFTATAYEIAEASIDNYLAYNILHVINLADLKAEATTILVGQLYGKYSGDLFTAMDAKYKERVGMNKVQKVVALNWLRFSFYSEAYPIHSVNGLPTRILDGDEVEEDDIMYGHILYVNGNPLYLQTNEILNLPYSNKVVTALTLPKGIEEEIICDYVAGLTTEDASSISNIKSYSYDMIVGQLYGTFEEGVSYYSKIYNKHKVEKPSWYQKINPNKGLKNIRLEIPKNITIKYRLYPIEGQGYNDTYESKPIISGTIQDRFHYKDEAHGDYTIVEEKWWSDGTTIWFAPEYIRDIKFERRPLALQTDISNIAIDKYNREYVVVDIDKYYYAEDDAHVFNNEFTPVEAQQMIDGKLVDIRIITHDGLYIMLPTVAYSIDYLTELRDIYTPIITKDELTGETALLQDAKTTRPILINNGKAPILNPHDRHVYNINGTKYIYYDEEWYPFDENNLIVLSKIDGLIDYTIEIERGNYV